MGGSKSRDGVEESEGGLSGGEVVAEGIVCRKVFAYRREHTISREPPETYCKSTSIPDGPRNEQTTPL